MIKKDGPGTPLSPGKVESDALSKASVNGASLEGRSFFENGREMRTGFAHEHVILSNDHMPVSRIGYLGGNRDQFVGDMNKLYGAGNWTIGYLIDDKPVSRDGALELYQKSYEAFFKANPEYTAKMLREARDVYDTNVSNVASGLDWHAQEDTRSHLQDIAVRRAVKELGLSFQGERLLQIRGPDSELSELNPGKVPFVTPEAIIPIRLQFQPWIEFGSVEDFWQNNKFLFVKHDSALVDKLRTEIEQDLFANKQQEWKALGDKLSTLILMGEGDRELAEKFASFLLLAHHRPQEGVSILQNYNIHWTGDVMTQLDHTIPALDLSTKQIIGIASALLPTLLSMEIADTCMVLSGTSDSPVRIGLLCALTDAFRPGSRDHGVVLGSLLTNSSATHPALEALETDPICQEHLKNSKFAKMSKAEIRRDVLSVCPCSDDLKERFLKALAKAKDS